MRDGTCRNGLAAVSFPRRTMYSTLRIALIGVKSESVSAWTSFATASRYFSAVPSIHVSFPVQYATTHGCFRAKRMIASYSSSVTKFGDSIWTMIPSSSIASRYSSGGTNVWNRRKLNPSPLRFAVILR